jgi:hypothetical protein
MCVPYSQHAPRIRRVLAIGNLCLVAGLLLWNFARPANQIQQNLLHGLTGLLIGFSITVNLCMLRFARRPNQNQPLT